MYFYFFFKFKIYLFVNLNNYKYIPNIIDSPKAYIEPAIIDPRIAVKNPH